MLTAFFANEMLLRRQLDPVAADDLGVGHEADLEVNVGLERGVGDVGEVSEVDLAFLEKPLGRSDQLRHRQSYLYELDHLVALQSIKNTSLSLRDSYNT